MDKENGNVQNSDYFSDAFSEYKYLSDSYDNYFNKTEKALIPTRKYARFWNKNIDGIFTDCLFVYELMKCKLEVKTANKRDRFNILTYAFKVKSGLIKHILSHADKYIDFDKLIDVCMKETEEFKEEYRLDKHSLRYVLKRKDDIYKANYIYEEILEFKNYVSTFVIQQKKITDRLSLHAVVNIREQFAVVLVYIDKSVFLCDFSDYLLEELDDVHRKYYVLEVVDKDFEFYSTHEDWRVPEDEFSASVGALHKLFTVFESDLQAVIPMPRQQTKTSVIKF